MATSNFHSQNDYGTFVVEIEEGAFYDDIPQQYRDMFGALQKEMGFEFIEGSRHDRVHSELRSFPSVAIGVVSLKSGNTDWLRKGGESVCEAMVSAQVVLRSGYYEHMNLDWEYAIESYHSELGSCYDMGDEPESEINGDNTPKVNQELSWMQAFIDREQAKLGEMLNKVCTRLTQKYQVSAKFSNGETWYEKA